MNYKSFNLGDWIGHISGVIEDETTLDGNEMRDLVEFLSTLEPCEDAISRQAALDIAFKYCPDDDGTCLEARSDLRNMLDEIEALPPAQPERKKGQWMKEDRGHVEYCAVCDQCGFDWIWSDREYFKFCPNCGADMRGEQDG